MSWKYQVCFAPCFYRNRIQTDTGYLLGRSLTNFMNRQLREAAPRWTELTSVTLHPAGCPSKFFSETLQILQGFSQIRHLAVNYTCMDETTAKILVQFNNLVTVVLFDPTRALLELITEWLSRLSPTLDCLHLRVGYILKIAPLY